MAYNITFSPDAWADYLYWQSEDKKTLKRINKLLQELQRDGAVQGIGKAELLRKIKGMSKRIDDTNRLVYIMYRFLFFLLYLIYQFNSSLFFLL